MDQQEKIKHMKERALRILARSGRGEALRSLHGYLNEYGLDDAIRRGEERAAAGDLETNEGVRSFINSI